MGMILRVLIAAVLFFAAIAKLAGLHAVQTMFSSLPGAMRVILVAAEFAFGLWLLSGWRPRSAAIITLALFSVFSGAIIVEMRKDHPQPCGCFGAAYVAAHVPATVVHELEGSLALDLLLMGATIGLFYTASAEKETKLAPEARTAAA